MAKAFPKELEERAKKCATLLINRVLFLNFERIHQIFKISQFSVLKNFQENLNDFSTNGRSEFHRELATNLSRYFPLHKMLSDSHQGLWGRQSGRTRI